MTVFQLLKSTWKHLFGPFLIGCGIPSNGQAETCWMGRSVHLHCNQINKTAHMLVLQRYSRAQQTCWTVGDTSFSKIALLNRFHRSSRASTKGNAASNDKCVICVFPKFALGSLLKHFFFNGRYLLEFLLIIILKIIRMFLHLDKMCLKPSGTYACTSLSFPRNI